MKYFVINAIIIKNISYSIFLFLISFIFISCKSTQNTIYFRNSISDSILHTVPQEFADLKIKKDDILSIYITSISPESAIPFNSSGGSVNNTSVLNGYIIDINGDINLVQIGKVHVIGLTRMELKQQLENRLNAYLKDPVVVVKVINHKITFLGNIARPGILNFPEDRISITDAIAQSGDINSTGNIKNILIVRDTDSTRIFKRVDLSDNRLFLSPFYYLKPNDIVYIEPKHKAGFLNTEFQQLVSLSLTTLSFIILIIRGFK